MKQDSVTDTKSSTHGCCLNAFPLSLSLTVCQLIFHMFYLTLSQAVMAESKQHALGVGITKMSSAKMYVVYWFHICVFVFTRGVQKVRTLTVNCVIRTSYFVIFQDSLCNWNALGSAFFQSSDFDIEELSFFIFQPAICHATRMRMANTVGDVVVESRHFGWQPVLELTCDQVHCPGSKWLLFVS